jgi:hypothetical protein
MNVLYDGGSDLQPPRQGNNTYHVFDASPHYKIVTGAEDTYAVPMMMEHEATSFEPTSNDMYAVVLQPPAVPYPDLGAEHWPMAGGGAEMHSTGVYAIPLEADS